MCGRFTLRTPANVLVRQFALAFEPELRPRYNIAPTQDVPVVRSSGGGREWAQLRWGLIPSWAKDPSMGSRMINARSETVAEKPSFRAAFKRRRCLVVADGYYEWQKLGKIKQPYYIRMRDDGPFALAGLWETWRGLPAEASDPLETCTIITTAASEATRPIHDRMPVILTPADYDLWLDPDMEDRERIEPLLGPYEANDLIASAVSTHVNSPKNDDPECVKVLEELF